MYLDRDTEARALRMPTRCSDRGVGSSAGEPLDTTPTPTPLLAGKFGFVDNALGPYQIAVCPTCYGEYPLWYPHSCIYK